MQFALCLLLSLATANLMVPMLASAGPPYERILTAGRVHLMQHINGARVSAAQNGQVAR